jgi:aryl-alcohol dehydrogenase-like predicted oxidoreductase
MRLHEHLMRRPVLLPTRELGGTGMAITLVGFGAWAIGDPAWPVGWGGEDNRDAIGALRHALDCGVNWIDAAAARGPDHFEDEVLRQALAEIPAGGRPYVFTQCGLARGEEYRGRPTSQAGTPASLRREVEASLRRLGIDRIDLCQMHPGSGDGTPLEERWGTLLDLKREGKVRAIGLSNHDVRLLAAAERIGHVDALQAPLSLIRREAAAAELPWCHRADTGVIAYRSLQSGLLAGDFTPERARALLANDWRPPDPGRDEDRLAGNPRLVEALRPIAEQHDTTVAAVAVAWTLCWPSVTGAAVGARSRREVNGWIDAARLVLTDPDLDEIAAAIRATGAGAGPARPVR